MQSVYKIKEGGQTEIMSGLIQLHSETQTLFLKTKKYYWNATEPVFQTYHMMFEEQSTELVQGFDLIVERIGILGGSVSGSQDMLKNPSATREMENFPKEPEMIDDLLLAHELAIISALSLFSESIKIRDDLTTDLLTRRIRSHQRTALRLKSLLNT